MAEEPREGNSVDRHQGKLAHAGRSPLSGETEVIRTDRM